MNRYLFSLLLLFILGCGSDKPPAPDVSHIQVNMPLRHFEKDFFSIDTARTAAELDRLQQAYGSFLQDYLYNILQLPPEKDSIISIVNSFIRDYKDVYQYSQKNINNLKEHHKQVEQAMRYVKHYFPAYPLPPAFITFIGPVEGFGNVLTESGLAVGLHMYLGASNAIYHSEHVRDIYPTYQSRRFKQEYIPVNCVKNIVDDLYPANLAGKVLVENMVEQGKRMYLLDIFLPETADTLKTGYTEKQLEACRENEAYIWAFFIENGLLFKADPPLIRDYVNDGPSTPVFGSESPGNIAQFVGWQIVKKYVKENPGITPGQLLQVPAQELFQDAKYKPK